MYALFKVIALSLSLALTSGTSLKIEAPGLPDCSTTPFTVTKDVMETIKAIEDANAGKIKNVCYKRAKIVETKMPDLCRPGWTSTGVACVKGFPPKFKAPGLYCPSGTTLDAPLCYGETTPGYTRFAHQPSEWMNCDQNAEKDINYDCGYMCTRNAEVCTDKFAKQATCTTEFAIDVATKNYWGAVGPGLAAAKAFANAIC